VAAAPAQRVRIGIDTGGTFTDLLLVDETGRVLRHKLLSTPGTPEQAVLDGVEHILQVWRDSHATSPGPIEVEVIHGSTVATNALLELKTAPVAFITTAGFEDLLWIGRQNRPQLYSLEPQRPPLSLKPEQALGVRERMLADGSVHLALDTATLGQLIHRLRQLNVAAVCICLLHSYANPAHEQRIEDEIRRQLPRLHITRSSELLPAPREYERAASCFVNATVAPVMSGYLGRLEEQLAGARLRIMGSAGGSLPLAGVLRHPAHTVLSGPAGGVLGALLSAQASGVQDIITFDMGGTSADVALLRGESTTTTEGTIAGLPLQLPMLQVHTVGAGGGSIAWLDSGGALRVGPQSAGADPGPACYGRQCGEPLTTVTDAHVVLGHLSASHRLGGMLALDAEAARAAVGAIARRIGLPLEEAAEGILRVCQATMMRALQRVSLQQGYDPRGYTLLPFGGAGGLHACALAELLGMRRILVPCDGGVLSALGMAFSAPLHMSERALLLSLPQAGLGILLERQPQVAAAVAELEQQALAVLATDSIDSEHAQLKVLAALRYFGQSYELEVSLGDNPGAIERFSQRHAQLYGYRDDQRTLELVTLRIEARGPRPTLVLPRIPVREPGEAMPEETTTIFESGRRVLARHYQRSQLCAGDELLGPALVSEYSATTLLPGGWRARVDEWGQLHIEFGAEGGA
jgi:N-methylhydantoinase A